MDKQSMLQALIDHFSDGNKSKFASKLGLSPQCISAWQKRDTFDAELLYTKCRGISSHWLLTGEGEMLAADEQPSPAADPMVDRLLSIIDQKDNIIREQAETIGSLRHQVEALHRLEPATINTHPLETLST